MARWALVLEAYRKQNGRYPDRLEQAVAFAPSPPGVDPFTGRLPVYRRTPQGYVLYCLGADGRDDGGLNPRFAEGALESADDWPWRHPGDPRTWKRTR